MISPIQHSLHFVLTFLLFILYKLWLWTLFLQLFQSYIKLLLSIHPLEINSSVETSSQHYITSGMFIKYSLYERDLLYCRLTSCYINLSNVYLSLPNISFDELIYLFIYEICKKKSVEIRDKCYFSVNSIEQYLGNTQIS